MIRIKTNAIGKKYGHNNFYLNYSKLSSIKKEDMYLAMDTIFWNLYEK